WVTTVTAVGPYAGNSAGTPFTARVESFTSGADPLPDTTPPLQSEIRVAAADDTVVVRWRTDEPAIGTVEIGPTSAYGITQRGAVATQNHEIVVPGLTPESIYHLRVSSEDLAGNRTLGSDRVLTTAMAGNESGLRSDTLDGPDGSLWSIDDPPGDATIDFVNGDLVFAVPGTATHDFWAGSDTTPKILQDVIDADFGVELDFGSLPTQAIQAQGLLFLEGPGRGLRVEIIDSGGLRLFVGSVSGAT